MLNVGDPAPEFALPDQTGVVHTLEGLLANGELILYFYPADFTPVCTAEACAFRDSHEGIAELGVQVVGISPQDTASHERFANRYQLPFPLLADPDKKTIRAYGVDGPFGFGVRRVTFHIDRTGIIRNRVISDFFVDSHVALLKKTIAGKA